MNTSIVKAVKLNDAVSKGAAQSLGIHAFEDVAPLPEGFPLLLSPSSNALVEPCFEFLWATHIDKGVFRKNTAAAEAADLADWWRFLSQFNLRWDCVTRSDLEKYRDLHSTLLSPRTQEHYASTTVRRRLTTVVSFYRYYNSRKRTSVDVGDVFVNPRSRIDSVALAHVSGHLQRTGNEVIPERDDGIDDKVKAFTPQQYRAVAAALGPLPFEDDCEDRSVRNRLWMECCVLTGLRPGEPQGISVNAILDLAPERPEDDAGSTYLRVFGKGRKWRNVLVPNLLLRWLHWYIDHERRDAIEEGRRRGVLPRNGDPGTLFVNSSAAGQNAGNPTTYDTFREAFHSAILKASATSSRTLGLMMRVTKTNPEDMQSMTVLVPGYVPHCLRHTFAVWTYLAEKLQGNAEPWKLIQARLGHAHLSTTQDLYLRLSNEFEARVSDGFLKMFGNLLPREGQ